MARTQAPRACNGFVAWENASASFKGLGCHGLKFLQCDKVTKQPSPAIWFWGQHRWANKAFNTWRAWLAPVSMGIPLWCLARSAGIFTNNAMLLEYCWKVVGTNVAGILVNVAHVGTRACRELAEVICESNMYVSNIHDYDLKHMHIILWFQWSCPAGRVW